MRSAARRLLPESARAHRAEGRRGHLAKGSRRRQRLTYRYTIYDLLCQVDASDPSSRLVGRLLNPSCLARWLREKLLPR